MSTADPVEHPPATRGERQDDAAPSRLSKVFELDRKGVNVARGLVILAVLLVPLVVLGVIGSTEYWLSVSFGALLVGLSDPGGAMGPRTAQMASIAVIGALLTALGFGIGAKDWWWAVLAAFAVTLVAGLAIRFGVNRFIAGALLNIWFVLAIGLVATYHHKGIHIHAWAQALAWLVGAVVWMAVLFIAWFVNGREPPPKPVPEIPGDISPRPLSRPIVAFSVLRALGMAVAVAIAYGFHLPNAYWMPLAAVIAMRPTLQESALFAEQRVAGALIGAVAAAVVLFTVDSKHALEALIVLLLAFGATIRMVNYAFYTALTAAAALIALDLPNPANVSAEVDRVLWTFAGVGIGVGVLLLAGLLSRRTAKTPPASSHPQPA